MGVSDLHAPAALPPVKNLGGAHWSLGEPQRPSGRFGEEKHYHTSSGIRTSDSAARVIVTILTEQSRLFFFLARFMSTFNCTLLAEEPVARYGCGLLNVNISVPCMKTKFYGFVQSVVSVYIGLVSICCFRKTSPDARTTKTVRVQPVRLTGLHSGGVYICSVN
jgi:hypothetical protein